MLAVLVIVAAVVSMPDGVGVLDVATVVMTVPVVAVAAAECFHYEKHQARGNQEATDDQAFVALDDRPELQSDCDDNRTE